MRDSRGTTARSRYSERVNLVVLSDVCWGWQAEVIFGNMKALEYAVVQQSLRNLRQCQEMSIYYRALSSLLQLLGSLLIVSIPTVRPLYIWRVYTIGDTVSCETVTHYRTLMHVRP